MAMLQGLVKARLGSASLQQLDLRPLDKAQRVGISWAAGQGAQRIFLGE